MQIVVVVERVFVLKNFVFRAFADDFFVVYFFSHRNSLSDLTYKHNLLRMYRIVET